MAGRLMTHADHLIALAPGAPSEPWGAIALRREETLGAWDARRKRYAVVATYHATTIIAEARAGSYAHVVERVAPLAPQLQPRQRLAVLVDVTASGRAILDLLRAGGFKPVPVVVAAAIGAKSAGRHVQVGEAELVARVDIVLAEMRLRVDLDLPGARELAAQLEGFSTAKGRAAPAKEFAAPAPRAELVRALSIGLWWGDRQMGPRIEQPRPPPQPIDCRPPTFDEAMKLGRR